MQINIQQTHHTIGDFDAIFTYIENLLRDNQGSGELFIFPELFLTGYPLQDLCLQRSFIERYNDFLEKLNALQDKLNPTLLLGGLDYEMDSEGLPLRIRNVIFEFGPKPLEPIYTKKLLPNYDIFDEQKYFSAGSESCIYQFRDKKFGLLICEDMWMSSMHSTDPVKELYELTENEDITLDGVINLSASPFYLGKDKTRLIRASEISTLFCCPFFYTNRVGGEDEILFDGSSFVVNGSSVTHRAKFYQPDILKIEMSKFSPVEKSLRALSDRVNSWESLFKANITKNEQGQYRIPELSDQDCEEILQSLRFGIQEYARKSGFKNFDVALSGGIDSALVLAVMKLSLEEDQNLEAIFMPGFFSATMSYDLSFEMCKKIGVKLTTFPIKFAHSSLRTQYQDVFKDPMEGLCDENIQSRLRGAILYARSNQRNSMVLNTSNKSELSVGYSTLYGDSVGAISPLGDLYKSEVFALSRYINKQYGEIIPVGIIDRPPSAELREDQEDSQSLPEYPVLDTILEGILSYRLSTKNLIEMGLDADEVSKVFKLYTRSEYKRKQFCPIIKIKAKSFGTGYRIPICKKN
ncbi:NH(3)-dependent NAD(+) synthetase [Halobacteriovorax marinus SJ]|uniref:Glutamine-dependent NAD(+) synthetase n=1 Tax=Halobacteriovorax marinus (strain ATCC BAA-682 / DSM 15412 / SJ) TaxID=862908 RepID=E1WZJ8_HALMS|nr:NAD(+) synthase [Halobacteriovorax marinus]CBW26184.1 NH(3)-dependent NAD(+) synthetase [Halobacteriovorax marinus SJ]